jgi:hypothetical protein
MQLKADKSEDNEHVHHLCTWVFRLRREVQLPEGMFHKQLAAFVSPSFHVCDVFLLSL